jgi:plasmid stabilization system protein ParE
MPSVMVLPGAEDDLARLEGFLEEKDADAAERLKKAITSSFGLLEQSPNIGTPFGRFKRLLVKFGKSKYNILYNYVEARDTVYVVSIWHSREDPSHPEHGLKYSGDLERAQ